MIVIPEGSYLLGGIACSSYPEAVKYYAAMCFFLLKTNESKNLNVSTESFFFSSDK